MTSINPASFGNNDPKINSKTNLNAAKADEQMPQGALLKGGGEDVLEINTVKQEPDVPPEIPDKPQEIPFLSFWGSFFRGPIFRIGSDFGWGYGGPNDIGTPPTFC